MTPVLPPDDDAEFRGMMADELRAAGFGPTQADTAAKADVVRGLEAGAHDCLAKPICHPVLAARLRAQLRHRERSAEAALAIGRWRFRPAQRVLCDHAGRRIRLTPKETDILRRLVMADGAVTKQGLLADIWGHSPAATTHTLATHICRLRRKIEADPRNTRLLLTTRAGYRLAASAV